MQVNYEKNRDDIRWKIASEFAAFMPTAFDEEFRRISGGSCDAKIREAEINIWKEAGKKERKYAYLLNLSLKNAKEVADAFEYISGALLGPDMTGEVTEDRGDMAKITIKSCPMLNHALDKGADTRLASEICRVFSKSAIESLNSAYTSVPKQSMCNGDPVCEIVVTKK